MVGEYCVVKKEKKDRVNPWYLNTILKLFMKMKKEDGLKMEVL